MSHRHPFPNLEPPYALPHLCHNADDLVAQHGAGGHCFVQDLVDVAAAQSYTRCLDQELTVADLRPREFFHVDVVPATEDCGFHNGLPWQLLSPLARLAVEEREGPANAVRRASNTHCPFFRTAEM